MICIAESGSTKTIWVVIDPQTKLEVGRFQSGGLNPFFVTSQEVAKAFVSAIPIELLKKLESVHFYGAGCSSEGRKELVREGLAGALKSEASCEIDHDLMAAARATCKTENGVVCILGTGSNSCQYNGHDLIDNVPSLGYALGDEGSGSDLGRRLLTAWLYREMSAELAAAFETEYDVTKETVLEAVYHRPQPNRYIASFAGFCTKHNQEPLIQQIIDATLEGFVTRHILKYQGVQDQPVHFVGSIAHHFKPQLKIILSKYQLQIGLVMQNPIDELVNYHLEHEL